MKTSLTHNFTFNVICESSCNSGDGTGQMAQPLMFMMMTMMMLYVY
jgi:hypothetical protein